jgi:Tfp pilus assembly protein PilF
VLARPSYVPARIQLGVTLLSLGESEAAGEEWRKALEIEPDNVRAKMYLRMVAAALSSRPPPVEAKSDDGTGGVSS